MSKPGEEHFVFAFSCFFRFSFDLSSRLSIGSGKARRRPCHGYLRTDFVSAASNI